jgi:hypothetical protein
LPRLTSRPAWRKPVIARARYAVASLADRSGDDPAEKTNLIGLQSRSVLSHCGLIQQEFARFAAGGRRILTPGPSSIAPHAMEMLQEAKRTVEWPPSSWLKKSVSRHGTASIYTHCINQGNDSIYTV